MAPEPTKPEAEDEDLEAAAREEALEAALREDDITGIVPGTTE